MKIKQCDVCKLIKEVPIVSISIPTFDEEHVVLRKFDLCEDCLAALAQSIVAFLNENVKIEDTYEF